MLQQTAGILAANFWMPEQASTVSKQVDDLFSFVLWVSIFFTVLIGVVLIVFVIKYRHREGVKRDTASAHSTALELTWTIIPTILVLIMFYYGFKGYLDMSVEPPGAMEINVKAQMWNWWFTYPNGAGSSELWIPVNTPVRFIMTSEDVIHSLYIPAFRVKKDVVPGRYNRYWFQSTQEGDYQIFCAEYCGKNHSVMTSRAHVVNDAEWKKKMAEFADWTPLLSPIEAGRMFYEARCKACHSIDGSTNTGPTFKDVYGSTVELADGRRVFADDEYVRRTLYEPGWKVVKGFRPGVMQSFKTDFGDHDVFAITAFLKSISSNFKGDLEPLKKITPFKPTTQPTTAPASPK